MEADADMKIASETFLIRVSIEVAVAGAASATAIYTAGAMDFVGAQRAIDGSLRHEPFTSAMREGSNHSHFLFKHIFLQQLRILLGDVLRYVRQLSVARSHPILQESSEGVTHCATFILSAFRGLPMRGASVAWGRPMGRS